MVSIVFLLSALVRAVIWLAAGIWVGLQIKGKRTLAPLWAVAVGLGLLGLHTVSSSILYAVLGQTYGSVGMYTAARWILDVAQIVPMLGIAAGLLGALVWGLVDRSEVAT